MARFRGCCRCRDSGVNQWVFDGDAKRTVDSGNTWHWAGTGLVGQGADSVMFGHRTEHGGPYRYQHLLQLR